MVSENPLGTAERRLCSKEEEIKGLIPSQTSSAKAANNLPTAGVDGGH